MTSVGRAVGRSTDGPGQGSMDAVVNAPVDGSVDGSVPGTATVPKWPLGRVLAAAVAAAGTALVLALLWGGGAPEPGQPGLPDAGQSTGWALQGAKVLYELAAVVAVGSLLVGVALAPPTGAAFEGAGLRAIRTVTWAGAVWAVAAGAAALLTVAEILGTPVGRLSDTPDLWSQLTSLAQPRALVLSAVAAAVVATYARFVRTPGGGWVLLCASVLALTPAVFTGHSAQAADHTVAVTSLVVHVVAAVLWVGGLLGLVLHLRRAPQVLGEAVTAFSALALVCFILVGGSGLVNAWTRLELSGTAWTTGYGAIVLAKVAAFVALGMFGWAHRQRTIRQLTSGRPGSFLRLAAGEVVVMAGTVGLAVALARTPTPSRPGRVAEVPAHGAGHDTLALTIEPFTPYRLLTEWQPDVIALSMVGVALALYLRGVVTVTQRGTGWPIGRTASFVGGLTLATFATCGGLAVYAPALFSVHIGRFLVLSLVVPLLLVAGRPLALAEQVAPPKPGSLRTLLGSGQVGDVLSSPVNAFGAYVVVTYGLYATPLLEKSLRAVPAHLFTSAAAVLVGLVLVSALLSAGRSAERSHRTVVFGLAVYLVLFAVVLASRDVLYAPAWFGDLAFTWVEPLEDQRRGARVVLVAAALVTPLLLLATRTPQVAERRRSRISPDR